MLLTDGDFFLRCFKNSDVSREVTLIAYTNFAVEEYGWIANVEERGGALA